MSGMTKYDLATLLLQELGYSESPGFRGSADYNSAPRSIPGIDGSYQIQGVPVAYFSYLETADPVRLWQLHRAIWNESKVPLWYVILPQEIRIYNAYTVPTEEPEEFTQEDRLLRHLSNLVTVEQARQRIQNELSVWYNRINLDTGAFWSTTDGQHIKRENRGDQHLLRAMEQIRRHLTTEIARPLNNEIAYALLGRSIFIRYLEDRDLLTNEQIYTLTNGRVGTYRDSLDSIDITLQFFDRLSQRFNGDIFPVEDEEKAVIQQEHLNLVAAFLDGTDLDSGQTSFWPYDFRYIPIELISGIYDTFLRAGKKTRESSGTYYTPLPLVDFVLNETLPLEAIQPGMSIFDPACGSGVFLVRAFQRLVTAEIIRKGQISSDDLRSILKNSIFGVDFKSEAIHVAAFSLYLAMLDYLDAKQVHSDNFRFPSLRGSNLLPYDFFSPYVREHLRGQRFDRVIGNPPWGDKSMTQAALDWAASRNFTPADNQIVQCFLLYAPEFCADKGEVALLAAARSTVLVTSGPHKHFRDKLFHQFNVRAIVNFTALVNELFSASRSPAVAIFYQSGAPPLDRRRLAYGVPKPSPLSRQLGAIILDATEVKYLDWDDLFEHPTLWKTAIWGTPRDAALIERLGLIDTLEQQVHKFGWLMEEGMQINGPDKNPGHWLHGQLLIPTTKVRPYVIEMKECRPIHEEVFHRTKRPEMFRAPLVLVHQSPKNEGFGARCIAAFSDTNVVYQHMINGVVGKPGQESLLKWLTVYINSPLVPYYLFLTSTYWAVERTTSIESEYKRLPFLVPDQDDSRFEQAIRLYDQIAAVRLERGQSESANRIVAGYEADLADIVFDLYDLTSAERQLIWDTINYSIEFFYWSKRKRSKPGQIKGINAPPVGMLVEYAETFARSVGTILSYQDRTLDVIIYQNGTPLSVVAFEIVPRGTEKPTRILETSGSVRSVLQQLDKLLLDRQGPTLYVRRHVRIYDGPLLYLVRPSEQRFWTKSQALEDADSAVADWFAHM